MNTNKILTIFASVLLVAVLFTWRAMAYNEPSYPAPGGSVNSAIDTGPYAQSKSGRLDININGGDLVLSTSSMPQIQFSDSGGEGILEMAQIPNVGYVPSLQWSTNPPVALAGEWYVTSTQGGTIFSYSPYNVGISIPPFTSGPSQSALGELVMGDGSNAGLVLNAGNGGNYITYGAHYDNSSASLGWIANSSSGNYHPMQIYFSGDGNQLALRVGDSQPDTSVLWKSSLAIDSSNSTITFSDRYAGTVMGPHFEYMPQSIPSGATATDYTQQFLSSNPNVKSYTDISGNRCMAYTENFPTIISSPPSNLCNASDFGKDIYAYLNHAQYDENDNLTCGLTAYYRCVADQQDPRNNTSKLYVGVLELKDQKWSGTVEASTTISGDALELKLGNSYYDSWVMCPNGYFLSGIHTSVLSKSGQSTSYNIVNDGKNVNDAYIECSKL